MAGPGLTIIVDSLPNFILAFLVSGAVLWFLISASLLQVPIDRVESGRTTRAARSRRLGGIALILVVSIGFFLDGRLVLSPGITALFLGCFFILGLGLIDDFRPLPWWVQFMFQLGLSGLLLAYGLSIDMMQGPLGGTWDLRVLPGLPALALIAWVLLTMNALNWLDGLDGLLGSVSLIGFLTLFLVSLLPEVNQPALAFLLSLFMGATAAFLVFNWPSARIMAGTTGAYFLGFALATLSVMAGAKVATALLVLVVPILDALFVLWERFRLGVSLFQPDARHLHYRLAELGWTNGQIVVLYTGLTIGMATLALMTRALEKLLVFGIAVIVMLGAHLSLQWWSKKRVHPGV